MSPLEEHFIQCELHIPLRFSAGTPAGALGAMPNSSAIGALGIRTNSTADTATSPARSLPSLTGALTSPLVAVGESSSSKTADTVVVDAGIPALKQSVVDLILADKYVDLGELPPAKGFNKPLSALSSGLGWQLQ